MSIKDNYLKLLEDIAFLKQKYGRTKDSIQLVGVTKNHPLDAVLELYEAGCHTFGESRWQEAAAKINDMPKDVSWHFIGSLQSNKSVQVARHFDLIHSVDSLKLAQKLNQTGETLHKKVNILLQINVSNEISKHGFKVDIIKECFEELLLLDHLSIKGLMTMAPLNASEYEIHSIFAGLRDLKDHLNASFPINMVELSMGMSNDYSIAIKEGATLLRVGSILFT